MTTDPNAKNSWRYVGALGDLAVGLSAPYNTVSRPYLHRLFTTVLSEKIALSPFIHRLNGG
jgi:hypothetical protein